MSRLTRAERRELRRFKASAKAVALCESFGVTPSKIQVRALAALPSDDDRRALIRELTGRRRAAARTPRPLLGATRALLESLAHQAQTEQKAAARLLTAEHLDDAGRQQLRRRWSN